ncbi:heterokaryon incompatibility protein-domain-containing protein [Bisporella sp. PMI_857]|nr:heterokaryon incompatibility protein-domain-containing protein [Bisporella sp. PMI_857]
MSYCNVCIEMGFHFDEIFGLKKRPRDGDDLACYMRNEDWQKDFYDNGKRKPHRGYPHHDSLASAIRSAALGCELCRLLITPTSRSTSNGYGAFIQAEDAVPLAERRLYVRGEVWTGNKYSCRLYVGKDTALDFSVFCFPVDEAILGGNTGSRPLYGRHMADAISIMPRQWMDKCMKTHSCKALRPEKLPGRVIDLGPSSSSTPRLLESKQRKGHWVVLSHCWGGVDTASTKKSNLMTRLAALPTGKLPKTFQDAIFISRELGFRYLWIDSLCIIQDSQEDWSKQSAQMGYIYKTAVVTLAVTMGEDSNSGILRPRDSCTYSLPLHVESEMTGLQGTLYFRRDDDFGSRGIIGPLSRRGWTLQEKLLSPRILHFAERMIYWECRATFETETDSSPRPMDGEISMYPCKYRPFSFINGNEDMFRWCAIINNYLSRNLTFSKDTLPAISGIAREFAAKTRYEYCAGLWKQDMLRGLLWTARGPARDGTARPHETYVAPSWSWASIRSCNEGRQIVVHHTFDGTMKTNRKHDAKVVSCDVAPLVPGDIYGQVISGTLVIEGYVRRASRDGSFSVGAMYDKPATQFHIDNHQPDLERSEYESYIADLRRRCIFLQIQAGFDGVFGLLLEGAGKWNAWESPYERRGRVEFPQGIESSYERGWERRIITIV